MHLSRICAAALFTCFVIVTSGAQVALPNSGPTAGGINIDVMNAVFPPPGPNSAIFVGSFGPATIVTWTPVVVVFTLPPGAGEDLEINIVIDIGDTVTCTNLFSYNAPALSQISPIVGPTTGGTTVTFVGTNLGPADVPGTVMVNTTPATMVTHTQTTGTFVTPPGYGVGNAVVYSVAGQESNIVYFHYSPPTLSSISPASGPTAGGTVVTATGTNFGPAGTPATVTVGGVNATDVMVLGHTTLTFKTPPGVGTNKAVVIFVGGQSNTPLNIWSYQPPSLVDIAPESGPTTGGTVVTAIGNNFGPAGTPASVMVGSVPATNVTVTGHSTLTFTTPPGTGVNVNLTITVGGQSSMAQPLWSYQAPSVSGVTPGSGPTSGGTAITITGANFGPAGTPAAVTINGISATDVNVVGHTSLTCTTPPGAGANRNVVVSVSGQSSTPAPVWSYLAPVIFDISPSSGPTGGGNTVILTGENFGPTGTAVAVTVDDVPPSMISLVSQTQIAFPAPPGSGAINDVELTVAGQPANVVNYAYAGPTVAMLTPNSGPEQGGTLVTVAGTNFGAPGAPLVVNIDGTPVQNLQHASHSMFTFTTPAGTGAGLPVNILVDGQAADPPPTFSYVYIDPAGVGIGTTDPHDSAALDVSSATQGMLVPRMTTAERQAIPSPANGLLVYDTNANAFFFFNGSVWKQLSFE